MDKKKQELSVAICIPVLNERDNIEWILTEISKELNGVDYTICIVDDGSKDGTLEIIQSLLLKNNRIHLIKREKKGYGCQRGAASRLGLEYLIKNTKHSVFVDIDADGAQRPAELIKGIEKVLASDCDIVIASRYVSGSKVIGRKFHRRLISYFYNLFARILFDRRIHDYSHSYRFYSRKAAEFLLASKTNYSSPIYILEILVKWIQNGFRILEIPTIYVERKTGHSKVKLVDFIKGFLGMLNIGLDFYTKRYYR